MFLVKGKKMHSIHLQKLASIILLLLIYSFQFSTFAQEQKPRRIQHPLFFPYTNTESLMALLDALAIDLQNESNKVACFYVYRKSNDLPGANFQLFNRIRYYLVENRGIDNNRLVFINSGIHSMDKGFECLIVLPDKEQQPGSMEPDIPENQSLKFDSHYYAMPYDICAFEIDCLDGEYRLAQVDDFAEVLKKRKGVKAYLVGYGSYRSSKLEPSKVIVQMLLAEKNRLVKKHGIDSSRIILINGGHRKTRSVDLWIVPPNGKKPTLTPDIFPNKKRRNIKVNHYCFVGIGYLQKVYAVMFEAETEAVKERVFNEFNVARPFTASVSAFFMFDVNSNHVREHSHNSRYQTFRAR